VTARSSNHSFPDGWLVMLQRICPVRLQSDRDPEFEHPEHCGGYVLSRRIAREGCTTGIRLDGPIRVATLCRAVFSPSVRKSRNLGTSPGQKLMKLTNL
jgi:hypothetical protein